MAPTKQEWLHLWNVALIINKSVWLLQQSFKSTNIRMQNNCIISTERLRPHEWNTYCPTDYLSLYFHLLLLSAAQHTLSSSQLLQRFQSVFFKHSYRVNFGLPIWNTNIIIIVNQLPDMIVFMCHGIKGHVSFLRNQWKKENLIRSANACRQLPGLSGLVQQLGFSCS